MPVATELIVSAWTPPPTIIGVSGTAEEPESHIQIDWTVSTLPSAEFVMYRIYRRLMGDELWDVLVDISNQSIVQHLDNTAGQQTQYEYMVTQFKTVTGDVPLESSPSEVVTIALETDAWFIVMTIGPSFSALELNVTQEEHSAIIQQEVFEPLASNFKRIMRGNILGDEGSVTFRAETHDAMTTKAKMETLKSLKGPHILKSPFGDVWFVEFDAPGYKYLPGGHLETTIGWVEIQ